MTQRVGRLLLEVAAVITVSMILLFVLHLLVGETPVAALGTSAHHLFLFMDIGLGVWVLLLIIQLVRRREPAASGRPVLFAIIGVIANLATVTVVGFVQQGGLAVEFIGFALEAGTAFLVAALLVALGRAAATRRARHARVADTAK